MPVAGTLHVPRVPGFLGLNVRAPRSLHETLGHMAPNLALLGASTCHAMQIGCRMDPGVLT
jgi:hypothetical protein